MKHLTKFNESKIDFEKDKEEIDSYLHDLRDLGLTINLSKHLMSNDSIEVSSTMRRVVKFDRVKVSMIEVSEMVEEFINRVEEFGYILVNGQFEFNTFLSGVSIEFNYIFKKK